MRQVKPAPGVEREMLPRWDCAQLARQCDRTPSYISHLALRLKLGKVIGGRRLMTPHEAAEVMNYIAHAKRGNPKWKRKKQ